MHVETNQSKIYPGVNLSLFSAISQRVYVALRTNLPVQSSAAFSGNKTQMRHMELGHTAALHPRVHFPPSLELIPPGDEHGGVLEAGLSRQRARDSTEHRFLCFILSSLPRVSCLLIYTGWPGPWLPEHRAHFSFSPWPVRLWSLSRHLEPCNPPYWLLGQGCHPSSLHSLPPFPLSTAPTSPAGLQAISPHWGAHVKATKDVRGGNCDVLSLSLSHFSCLGAFNTVTIPFLEHLLQENSKNLTLGFPPTLLLSQLFQVSWASAPGLSLLFILLHNLPFLVWSCGFGSNLSLMSPKICAP